MISISALLKCSQFRLSACAYYSVFSTYTKGIKHWGCKTLWVYAMTNFPGQQIIPQAAQGRVHCVTEYSCFCSKDEALELSSETDFPSWLQTHTHSTIKVMRDVISSWDAENSSCNSAEHGCRSGSSVMLHINIIQLKWGSLKPQILEFGQAASLSLPWREQPLSPFAITIAGTFVLSCLLQHTAPWCWR